MNPSSNFFPAGTRSFYKRLDQADWLSALATMAGALFLLQR